MNTICSATSSNRSTLRRLALGALCAATALVSGCGWLQDQRDEHKGIQMAKLVPASGYSVSLLAEGLPKARHLALGSAGTLFVGSMAGNVYALTLDGGRVVSQRTLLQGLTDPSGVAFMNGSLYVANRTQILRFDNIEQTLERPGKPVAVLEGLPDKARHDAHAMAAGPDGKLYVSVGSPCNTCEARNDEYGVIVRIGADGSGKEIVARGLRNSVGFDWHPKSRELWFTENGQDELGLGRPNDELNKVSKVGENFGFPYCHDANIADPDFGAAHACKEFTPPAFGLGPHVAALGMRFERAPSAGGEMAMIIARHGSHPPTRVGYDVVRLVGEAGASMRMEPFLSGFLEGNRYWGRPVDVLTMADGSVLISDDLNGAIYRMVRNR